MRCWFPSLVTTSASSIRLLKRAYSASGRQPPEAQRRQISRGVGTMDLPLEGKLKVGVNTMHRRTEPAVGPWQPSIDELVAMVRQVDDLGYDRSEEHTSELQSLMRISYAVFCLKKKITRTTQVHNTK